MREPRGRLAVVAVVTGLVAAGCGEDEKRCGAGTVERGGDCVEPADGGFDAAPDAAVDAGPEVYANAEQFFAAESFPEIELTLPPETIAAPAEAPRVYQPGTLRIGDVVLEDVGVRLKGAASFRGIEGKAAFKIKMDEFVAGQRLFGLRRLTLNNLLQDPSGVRERLGYRFMRAAGVVAPRCNNARVTVNGEYWGLYANVETLDDEFVEDRFGGAVGNLYDITSYFVDLLPGSTPGFELETNKDVGDRSRLDELIAVVNDPDGAFAENVEAELDLDAVLRLGATQAILADWDGYFGARNNYKLYDDVESGRFVLLPWGIDQTFGSSDSAPVFRGAEYDIYGTDSDRYNGWLFLRCKAERACLGRYQAAVAAALEVWNGLPLETELDAMVEQIQGSVAEDSRSESGTVAFENSVRQLRAYLGDRAAEVQAQLDGPLPELCENGVDDDGDDSVDCDDADCTPLTGSPFQALCTGQDFSCAGEPPPDEVSATITLSGSVITVDQQVLGATIDVLSRADGSVLATTTTDRNGRFEVTLETGGLPLEVTLRESLDGYVTNRRSPPPLVDDLELFLDVLFRPDELDALAQDVGLARDSSAGILALETVDCAGVRLFNPDIGLEPAPPTRDETLVFGIAMFFDVPPGELEVTGAFESHAWGPVAAESVAGEITLVRLAP